MFPFGTQPLDRLSREAEAVAPFEERLRSVWRYLVKRVKRFSACLSEHERSHMGPGDLVNDVVIALLEKDQLWSIERGRYVTFAEQVMRNVLSEKREDARVVSAPSNAYGRLRNYHGLHAQEILSARSTITMRAIEAVLATPEALNEDLDPAFKEMLRSDCNDIPDPANTELTQAIRDLGDPRQSLVLGKTYGLFGGSEETPEQIARRLRSTSKAVKNLQARAKTALRRRIQAMRRPPDDDPH